MLKNLLKIIKESGREVIIRVYRKDGNILLATSYNTLTDGIIEKLVEYDYLDYRVLPSLKRILILEEK